MNHSLNVEVAKKLGVNAALIIANLAYLQHNRQAQGGEKYHMDGRWWVHHTYESLATVHPYFSVPQIKRIMKSLVEQKAVFKRNPDHFKRDCYWSVAPEFTHSTKSYDGKYGIAPSESTESYDVLHDNEHRTITPCSPPSKIPVQQIVDLYHQLLPMLPPVRKLTKAREGYIKQRWREGDLPSIEVWEKYFGYVSQSKFLTGGIEGRDGKPPFRADLEWITKPANYAKIFEGKYHV